MEFRFSDSVFGFRVGIHAGLRYLKGVHVDISFFFRNSLADGVYRELQKYKMNKIQHIKYETSICSLNSSEVTMKVIFEVHTQNQPMASCGNHVTDEYD